MDLNISPMLQDNPDAVKPLSSMEENCKTNGNELSTEMESKFSSSSSYGQLNSGTTDPSTELTEDDIFRMKSLSFKASHPDGPTLSELQSAVSNVDSTSNYEDDQQLEEDASEELEENQTRMSNTELTNGTNELRESNEYKNKVYYILFYCLFHFKKLKIIYNGGYVFGRVRPEKIELNQETGILKYFAMNLHFNIF